MTVTKERLNEHFNGESDCTLIEEFKEVDANLLGKIQIVGSGFDLQFSVCVSLFYPFQFFETESIKFINEDLLEYGHIGIDGVICIHTSHNPDLGKKLLSDTASLREWIEKYYLGNANDGHYEHLKLPYFGESNKKQILFFTNTDHSFKQGEYGNFHFSSLNFSTAFNEWDKNINTYLLQKFEIGKETIFCKWNNFYRQMSPLHKGFFVFLKAQPSWLKHFAFDTWDEFQAIAPQALVDFLHYLKQQQKAGKLKGEYYPLLVGYDIPIDNTATEKKPHWQLINIPLKNIPIHGKDNGNGKWDSVLNADKIIWCETRECSYSYFFGRGKMDDKITNARILIIGTGAIGSSIATTLARCGAKKLGLIDYEDKEPENVCRSEFMFISGIGSKVEELGQIITGISPFCDIIHTQKGIGIWKSLNPEYLKASKEFFNSFDIIFDCSTDNDVAYILDQINPQATIINLSITNHAKELVCATGINSYQWMIEIFRSIGNDTKDLHNPTGCWSPTFKASYNDINVLVQYALKQINHAMANEVPLRNFYLSTSYENGFTIKLNQF